VPTPSWRKAHRYLDWMREQTEALDGTDESLWFLQGVLQSMSQESDEEESQASDV
jgi:hypothetical protein